MEVPAERVLGVLHEADAARWARLEALDEVLVDGRAQALEADLLVSERIPERAPLAHVARQLDGHPEAQLLVQHLLRELDALAVRNLHGVAQRLRAQHRVDVVEARTHRNGR